MGRHEKISYRPCREHRIAACDEGGIISQTCEGCGAEWFFDEPVSEQVHQFGMCEVEYAKAVAFGQMLFSRTFPALKALEQVTTPAGPPADGEIINLSPYEAIRRVLG